MGCTGLTLSLRRDKLSRGMLAGRPGTGLSGAQGRDRTTDTAIFSRMLYQLSYLGNRERAVRKPNRPFEAARL